MPISFNNIPQNWRVPLYWVEVDPSKAGLQISRRICLLVGYKTSAGQAATDVPTPIGTQAAADAAFGQGSMLAQMFKSFYLNNFAQEVWGLPLAEPVAGTSSTGTLTVTTPPTQAGSIDLYIGGMNVPVGVSAGQLGPSVATAIQQAIVANPNLPVTATVATNVVTLTARHKGIYGNEIDVRSNYYGQIGGETTPIGLVLTYPSAGVASGMLSGGAGAPVMTNAIINLSETEFEFVALPFLDSTSLLAWETEYGFSDSGRWGWMRAHYGHLFSAMSDTYANLLAFGVTRNSAQLSIMGMEIDSPTPNWEVAAAYAAKAARAFINDPARPLQTLSLDGVLAAQQQNRFNLAQVNALATSGMATQRTPVGTTPMISRETTTSTLNKYGFSDDAYELVTTLATLAALIRNQRQAITSKFPRHKLADDGTRFGAGQAIVTPKIIKAELVSQYRIDEFNGLVENAAKFKDNLIVERDPNDPNRVNVLYPPDLVNQLRIFAVLAQFRLQYDRGLDTGIIGVTV